MIERAVRETSLYKGRVKNNTKRPILDGQRPQYVCEMIYECYGIASQVAKCLGVHYTTVNNWKKVLPWVKDAFIEARETMLDVAESSLMKAVTDAEGWATCFLLKCRGKDRGYVEKLVLGGSLDSTVRVSLTAENPDDETSFEEIN